MEKQELYNKAAEILASYGGTLLNIDRKEKKDDSRIRAMDDNRDKYAKKILALIASAKIDSEVFLS